MADMHLIKLCVGVDSVEQLAAWQTIRLEKLGLAGAPRELIHRTRHKPRQAEAVLKHGSLYWVIKGSIKARQKILELREETDAEARTLCGIVLDHALMATLPQPRRPFQGWRYLHPEDAPLDLGPAQGADEGDIPVAMRAELMALSLL
jgi:hypothetical protein